MSPESILAKTGKGAREIETRENRLDHRLRALLIMVNGKASAGELAKKFAQIGDIGPMLDQLVAQGFIAEQGAGPAAGAGDLKRAQAELCMHLRNALGPDADSLTGRIEACRSVPELRAFFEGQRNSLSQWLGKSKSAAFWAKADPYLR